VKDSPLFHLRTQRAIDKEENIQKCTYLGKGKENILMIPQRNSETSLVQKFIKGITKMNDDEFDRFVRIAFDHLKKDKTITDKTINEIIQSLYLLRMKPDKITNFMDDMGEDGWTEFVLCTVDGHWAPGCFVRLIGWFIVGFFLAIFFYLATVLGAYPTWCFSYGNCC
jgi:hypothetical protein